MNWAGSIGRWKWPKTWPIFPPAIGAAGALSRRAQLFPGATAKGKRYDQRIAVARVHAAPYRQPDGTGAGADAVRIAYPLARNWRETHEPRHDFNFCDGGGSFRA